MQKVRAGDEDDVQIVPVKQLLVIVGRTQLLAIFIAIIFKDLITDIANSGEFKPFFRLMSLFDQSASPACTDGTNFKHVYIFHSLNKQD